MNLMILGITLIICGMIAIWFGADHKKDSDKMGMGRAKEFSEELRKSAKDLKESIFTKQTGNYYHFQDYKPNAFKPYLVSVKDEHSVVLTADNDTIVLYLENATNMAEEKLIYIFPKN